MSPADPAAELRSALGAAIASLGGSPDATPVLERPPKPELGDYSTNAAMVLAGGLGDSPRAVAERLGDELEGVLGSDLDRTEVAGPGFVNLFLTDEWHRRSVADVLKSPSFGTHATVTPSVLLEFVSANPTGPVTVASGRGAAFGDSLARVLTAAGAAVSREYYVNDSGTQIRNFAVSIAARMQGEEIPEDGYAGEYVGELGEELRAAGLESTDLSALEGAAPEAMRARIEASLERFGVHYDTWTSERSLLDQGALDATLAELREGGNTYDSEGALWLRTSEHGDDKDRVLVRSSGEPTYFAVDIAYHRDKMERGAEQMIVPLGADHHGYVPRMRAAFACLGADPERYEAPIMQLVNIVEGGERARMSKRQGDFVTLDELVDDIGSDAARFFLVQRSPDTTFDLDLELARSQSQENPVYYVQYAHARIASIVQKARREAGVGDVDDIAAAALAQAAVGASCEPSERELIRRLVEFPGEVATAAAMRAPHRLAAYSQAVAADFHGFYRDCRVVGADEEAGVAGLEAARLGVCLAARGVIASSLGLLGISAPEQM